MNSLIKTNNLSPEEEYRAKLLRVFELAMQINPTETERSITENKPTVFLRFSGHVSRMNLQIHGEGWDYYDKPSSEFDFITYDYENPYIGDVIDMLEYLYDKWGEENVRT